MTAALSLADAQALAARATERINKLMAPWRFGNLMRDRDAIASALTRMERHAWEQDTQAQVEDYVDACTDLLRHCAPYTEVPS